MDINKLFEKIMSDEMVSNIPVIYVFTVLNSILDAISSGECFYKTDFE